MKDIRRSVVMTMMMPMLVHVFAPIAIVMLNRVRRCADVTVGAVIAVTPVVLTVLLVVVMVVQPSEFILRPVIQLHRVLVVVLRVVGVGY